MPIYEYKCRYDHISEQFVRKYEPEVRITCDTCGKPAELIMSLNAPFDCGFKPYTTDHITGHDVLLTSRSHRAKLLKEHGLVEAG